MKTAVFPGKMSLDSASVMVGRRNSVLSRVIQQQPEVFSLGCVCHLAALCAAAAIKKIPIPIDGLLIDIYYHFKHSSKRYYEFAEILQEFEGIAPLNIVNPLVGSAWNEL